MAWDRLSVYGLFILSDDIQLTRLKIKKIRNQLTELREDNDRKTEIIKEL